MMKNKCVAVIGPSFFGYGEAIALRMSEKGVSAFFMSELFSDNKIIRSMIRFGVGFVFSSFKKKHYGKIIDTLIARSVTDVLLISVEDIDVSLVRKIKDMSINVHLYMWDGLNRKRNCLCLLEEGVNFATFDPNDASDYVSKVINLFAEDVYVFKTNSEARANVIAFAGTLHSVRPNFIVNFMRNIKYDKFRYEGLMYYPSKTLFLFKCFLNLKILSLYRLISSRGFTKQQIAILFRTSKFVLDIPFPSQKGLTSRTFEALMSGAFLITTMASIGSLPKSLHSRVLIYNEDTFANDIDNMSDITLPDLTDDERYFLSLDRFVDEIFQFMEV